MMKENAAITTYRVQYAPAMFEEGGPVFGFDQEGDVDHDSPRTAALYAACDTTLEDEEMVLGTLPDGRWALVGLTVEGYQFAVEAEVKRPIHVIPDLVPSYLMYQGTTPPWLELPDGSAGVRWANGTTECRSHIEDESWLSAMGGCDLSGSEGAGTLLFGEIACDACAERDAQALAESEVGRDRSAAEFEEAWREHGVHPDPPVLELAFKELALKFWQLARGFEAAR